MSEKELIIGMVIGDGCITKSGYFCLSHSIKQEGYLNYKKKLLLDYNIKCSENTIREPSGYGVNQLISFRTSTSFLMKEINKYMYNEEHIKIIPNNLIITPFMWSLIYQDDGRQNKISHYTSYKDGIKHRVDVNPWVNRYTIYTDGFDLNSVNNLQKSLMNYNITSSISYSNKNKYPHIHISQKESKENFKEMIQPYICDNMKYKLDLPTYIIQK